MQKVRAAASRVDCQSRLRQLGIALHQHNDTVGRLPPGHRSYINRDLMPLSGWTLSVLPFLEQAAVYDTARAAYRKTLNPFNKLLPHPGLTTVIPAFVCPSDPRAGHVQTGTRTLTRAALTSYLGVIGDDWKGKQGLLYQDSRHRLADATDGTSNTMLLGERPPSADFQFGWWYAGVGQRTTGSADVILGVREPNLQPIVSGSTCGPGQYPYRPAKGTDDPCGMFHFWSLHPGGANFALADGSVRLIGYAANPLMPALASRAGGETAGVPE